MKAQRERDTQIGQNSNAIYLYAPPLAVISAKLHLGYYCSPWGSSLVQGTKAGHTFFTQDKAMLAVDSNGPVLQNLILLLEKKHATGQKQLRSHYQVISPFCIFSWKIKYIRTV